MTHETPAIFKANQVQFNLKERQALLTDKEAAAYLNLSTSTLAVWRCTKRQEIPFVKLGRAVRYRQVDLDAWLLSQTIGAVA